VRAYLWEHSLGNMLDLLLGLMSVHQLDDGWVQEKVFSLGAPMACKWGYEMDHVMGSR